MASDFPAFVAYNHDEYDVAAFPIASTNAGKAGSLCLLNTGTGEIDECGADPALILGLMTGPYSARQIYDGDEMPVVVLDSNVVVGLCSATTPSAANLEVEYGVVKLASGNWAVDTTETVATRVHVVKIDIAAGIYYCKFLAANLQGDAVVS